MSSKKRFGRRKTQPFPSSPTAAQPTAPPHVNSEPVAPFSPFSSFSKVVSLSDWWLIKSDTDADGKRLAVEGFSAQEMFTSAPIVERDDAFTVKTADGITVMFQGFINKPRTHQNGFPPEVSRCFLVGFPSNWDYYADEDFLNKPTSPIKQPGSSWTDKQWEHLSHATGSSNDTSGDGNLSRDFNCPPGKPNVISSASTTLSDQLDIHSAVANASLPVEPLGMYEVDKSNQNREKRCADRITHGAKENETGHATKASCSEERLHYAVLGTRSDVDDRVIISHNNPLTVKPNCMRQHETGQDMQSEKGTEFEKDNNLARFTAGNLDPIALLPNDKEDRSNDESTSIIRDSVVEGVLNDLSSKERFQRSNQSENYDGEFQNNADKTRDHGAVIFEDFQPIKNSVGMHCNSLAAKMNLPLEASFKSPPSGAHRNVDNTIGLADKVSSSLRRVLCSKHAKRFADYAERSGNCAQRIRLDHTCDSEVRRNFNRNEADSLTVNPCTVLENLLKSSKSDKDAKLNNKHTISSADPIKKVLNRLPTERKRTHEKLESMQCPYALRSRNRVEKTVENNNMCVVGDSLGRKNSKEADANSLAVEMNVPSEPVLDMDVRRSSKAPKNKREGNGNPAIEGRLEVENERRYVGVEHKYTNVLRGVKLRGHIHAQCPVTGGFLAGTHVSPLEESSSKFQHNLQFCSTSSTSPDGINKKGVDHSEHRKAGDITRKRVLEPPNNQEGNQPDALTEAHHSKKKTSNIYKRKTIQRPSYSQEFHLNRDKAEKLSVTSPELCDLKRTRSGRLIVPPIESWRQVTIRHDRDGTIIGIARVYGLDASCKGTKSQRPKKRQRRQ